MTVKQFLLGIALIITAVFGYLLYQQQRGGNAPKGSLPPEIVIRESFYATSTNELVVRWLVENVERFSRYNTGIRYDTVSYATTTPTSETYEKVKLPPEIADDGTFEMRVDFGDAEELFFRVQVAPPVGDEFVWSEERSVKREPL